MRSLARKLLVVAFGLTLLMTACGRKRDFVPFLRSEINSLGGKTEGLVGSVELQGKWAVKRDQWGELIETDGIQFEAITNILTRAYGQPKFYTRASPGRGPIYLYPPANAGIAISVCITQFGAELDLLKPMRFDK
jgi:hypothetical protein